MKFDENILTHLDKCCKCGRIKSVTDIPYRLTLMVSCACGDSYVFGYTLVEKVSKWNKMQIVEEEG